MDMVDVLFYIRPELSSEERAKIESELWEYEGVLSVHFNQKYHHLLTVKYNPHVINSAMLLNRVGSNGVSACRIGL